MRRTTLLIALLASPALAQNPSAADAARAATAAMNSSMAGAGDAMRASSGIARSVLESRSKAAELKIQQGWLDLARQQAQQQNAQGKSSIGLQPNGDITQALLLARMGHNDFDALVPSMQIIAEGIRPDWSKLTMGEYLECLYVIAKNASFAVQLRDRLLSPAPPLK
jgi:hypothetical protein